MCHLGYILQISVHVLSSVLIINNILLYLIDHYILSPDAEAHSPIDVSDCFIFNKLLQDFKTENCRKIIVRPKCYALAKREKSKSI